MSEISVGLNQGRGSAVRRFRDTIAYDALARLPLILWFAFSGSAAARNLFSGIAAAPEFTAAVALEAAARLAGLGFVLLLIVALSLRLRPVARAQGLLPRLAAFCGTFSITGLAFLPKAEMPPALAAVSLALILIGYGLACYAVAHLGRSLSMMAEARRLVTSGPYAVLRHPRYAAEAIASVGFLLQFLSLPALILWAAHIALQCCRMHYEEQILRQAFPEYQAYSKRVARLVPGVY
ncbi:MAG: methyltransferase [Acetobacteraceae bacterium]|nr:methyltransferase [Acetobacteraceae bacterium]